MTPKIQQIITSIYDWLDSSPAFNAITKASRFCDSEYFLEHRSQLYTLVQEARVLLNEFSEHIEKIILCMNQLGKGIEIDMVKKHISDQEFQDLIKNKTIQVKIKDLLIVAKRLETIVNSQNVEKTAKDGSLLKEAKTLSELILTKYEDM